MEITTEEKPLHLWDYDGESWIAARDEDHLREICEDLYGYFDPDEGWSRIDDDEVIMFWWNSKPKNIKTISVSRLEDGHPNPEWTYEVHAKASAWANGAGPGLVASVNY